MDWQEVGVIVGAEDGNSLNLCCRRGYRIIVRHPQGDIDPLGDGAQQRTAGGIDRRSRWGDGRDGNREGGLDIAERGDKDADAVSRRVDVAKVAPHRGEGEGEPTAVSNVADDRRGRG